MCLNLGQKIILKISHHSPIKKSIWIYGTLTNKAFEVRAHAYKLGIHLHYLPAYSPNLNPIERVWKFMNEEERNNVFFETPKDFKTKIKRFFKETLPQSLPDLRSRINDTFELKPLQTHS